MKKINGLVTISQIAKEINSSYTNVYTNYVKNKNRDKTDFLKVLAFGAYVAINGLDEKELKKAITIFKELKES